MQVLIDAIIVDDGTQTRVKCDDTLIAEYAEQYQRDRNSMPPVDLFQESKGQTMWMADGFHRYYAAKKIGVASMEAKVHKGNKLQAIIHSLKSNASHGLRRKPEDIQKAIKMAWDNRANIPELGANPSARTLAKLVNCSDMTVTHHLHTYAPERKSLPINGADGKTYSPVPPQRPRSSVPPQKASLTPPSPKTVPPVPAQHRVEATPKTDILKDELGSPIPVNLFPELGEQWDKRTDVAELAESVSQLRCTLKKEHEAKNAMYARLHFSELDMKLDSIYHAIKDCVPYTVCGICSGNWKQSKCMSCNGGFMSKGQWTRLIPNDRKDLILKSRAGMKAEGLK